MNRTSVPSSRRHLRRLTAVVGGALLGLGSVLALAAPASAHDAYVKGSGDCPTDNGWTATITLSHDWQYHPASVTSVDVTAGNQHLNLVGIAVGTRLALAGQSGDSVTGTVAVPAGIDAIHVEIEVKWDDGHGPKLKTADVTPLTDCAPPTTPPATKPPSATPSAPSTTPSAPASESPSPTPGAGGGGPQLPTTGASIGTAVGIAAVLLAAGAGLFFFFRRRRIRFTA